MKKSKKVVIFLNLIERLVSENFLSVKDVLELVFRSDNKGRIIFESLHKLDLAKQLISLMHGGSEKITINPLAVVPKIINLMREAFDRDSREAQIYLELLNIVIPLIRAENTIQEKDLTNYLINPLHLIIVSINTKSTINKSFIDELRKYISVTLIRLSITKIKLSDKKIRLIVNQLKEIRVGSSIIDKWKLISLFIFNLAFQNLITEQKEKILVNDNGRLLSTELFFQLKN